MEIIIPTFRRPATLRRTIESALAQTYPYFEVHVYDDASGDETAEAVDEYARRDPRVFYHGRESNIGVISNLNDAMLRVRASFFTLTTDDDYLHSEFLERAVGEFDRYPESYFVSMGVNYVDEEGRTLRPPQINTTLEGYYDPPEGMRQMLSIGVLNWVGILFRREVVEQVGVLTMSQNFANDLDYLIKIAVRHPIRVSALEGAYFTEHAESYSSWCKLDWFWPGYLETIHFIVDEPGIPHEAKEEAKRILLRRLKGRILYAFVTALCEETHGDATKAISIIRGYYQDIILAVAMKTAQDLTKLLPRPMKKIARWLLTWKPKLVILVEKVALIKYRSRATKNMLQTWKRA
ncbi:MAG: glycosyltransferase family 2 protein [Candidatus Nitrospinota bacterium M3_3B_026]